MPNGFDASVLLATLYSDVTGLGDFTSAEIYSGAYAAASLSVERGNLLDLAGTLTVLGDTELAVSGTFTANTLDCPDVEEHGGGVINIAGAFDSIGLMAGGPAP